MRNVSTLILEGRQKMCRIIDGSVRQRRWLRLDVLDNSIEFGVSVDWDKDLL